MATHPLFDADLEAALLAEAVFDYPRFMALGLSRDDFAVGASLAVFDACLDAWEHTGSVNVDTVTLQLGRRGTLHMVDGPVGFAQMLVQRTAPDPDRLRELRRLRRLREQLSRAQQAVERGAIDEALDLAAQAHEHGMRDATEKDDILNGRDVAELVIKNLTEPNHYDIHPGLRPLLNAIGKLAPGSVLVIAAPTNVGKSSLILEQVLASGHLGQGAGIISVEDPNIITGERTVGALSGISPQRLRKRDINPDDWVYLSRGAEQLTMLGDRYLLAQKAGATELDVCATMSRMAARGAKLIVVDYIGTIRASRAQQDRRNEVSFVLTRLKAHADRLEVALVLVSQLKRPENGDPSREPTKHDLKESGDLENAAEIVVVMWREEENDFAPVQCKIAKSKVGGNGVVWLMQRDRHSSRFHVVDGEPEPW